MFPPGIIQEVRTDTIGSVYTLIQLSLITLALANKEDLLHESAPKTMNGSAHNNQNVFFFKAFLFALIE